MDMELMIVMYLISQGLHEAKVYVLAFTADSMPLLQGILCVTDQSRMVSQD